MKAKIVMILMALCVGLGLTAQDDVKGRILIFRNTGEINILRSDSIAKVELSVFDADSVEHTEFVSQVFHYKNNKAMVVPLAEIDSVAFGLRNIIEPKKGVRRLTDEEAGCISSFNGETIEHTNGLSLSAGEYVYYDRLTKILPCGLCVEILSVGAEGSIRKATVRMCDPLEVFDRYLITGDGTSESMLKTVLKADDYDREPFKIEFKDVEIDGVKFSGKVETLANIDAEDIVVDVLKGCAHANLKLSFKPEVEFKALSEDRDEINWKSPQSLDFEIPFLNGAFNIGVSVAGFVDFKAEAGIEYKFGTEYFTSIDWSWSDGRHQFTNPETLGNVLGDMEQKVEVHLDGELYLGVCFDLTLNTLFRLAGAGVEVKAGPKVEADFGIGVLSTLSDHFDSESYGKAHLDVFGGLKTETYYYLRNLKNFHEIEKVKLPFESEWFSKKFRLNLFPEFHSKAVLTKKTAPVVQTPDAPEAVSVSTFTSTELPYPIDVDFEIADKATDATIAEVRVEENIEPGLDKSQNLSSEIEIPVEIGKIDKDGIVARPIINYKGYRVKAASVDVSGDMVLTPMIASMCEGGAYFVSGMTPVSQSDFGDDTYIEGNLVGLQTGDPRHRRRSLSTVDFVDLSDLAHSGQGGYLHPLIGDWTGEIVGEGVIFSFINDSEGEYNGNRFAYRYDAPKKGGILIQLDDGGTISFSILEIADGTMTIVMKGSDTRTILTRI